MRAASLRQGEKISGPAPPAGGGAPPRPAPAVRSLGVVTARAAVSAFAPRPAPRPPPPARPPRPAAADVTRSNCVEHVVSARYSLRAAETTALRSLVSEAASA